MTVTRLSACAVKVQLTAEELQGFLPDETPAADSPQMLRLLSLMLMHAEAGSGIRFSALPVTVELLSGSDGSLTAYFTAQLPASPQKPKPQPQQVRLAASFSDYSTLKECCDQLSRAVPQICESTLHRCCAGWVLSLKTERSSAPHAHHLLLEYGKPFRSNAVNKARLAEYGHCIYAEDAVKAVVRENQRKS